MRRVLADIDAHVERLRAHRRGARPRTADPSHHRRPRLPPSTCAHEGITAVIWATGYRRTYPGCTCPVLDAHGEIRQYRGVTPVPGVYVIGQRFQHRRNSNFIDGVGRDAAFVADHLTGRTAAGSPTLNEEPSRAP